MDRHQIDDATHLRWYAGWDEQEHTYVAERRWTLLPKLTPALDHAGDNTHERQRAIENFHAQYDGFMRHYFGHDWHGVDQGLPDRGDDLLRYFLTQSDLAHQGQDTTLRDLPEPDTRTTILGTTPRQLANVEELADALAPHGVWLSDDARRQLTHDRATAEGRQSRAQNFPPHSHASATIRPAATRHADTVVSRTSTAELG